MAPGPCLVVGLAGFEPAECRSQSPVPCRLATAQCKKHPTLFIGGRVLVGWVMGFEPMVFSATN